MQTYVLAGGVGYDSAADSSSGGACCAANTYASWGLECFCMANTIATDHYSKTPVTVDDKNLGCVTCSDIDAAKSTTFYNGIELEHFLTAGSDATTCSFASVLFNMINLANTDFRCKVPVDTTTSKTESDYYAMQCDTPSDETVCKATLRCLLCSEIKLAVSGFTFGSSAGLCGCTSGCNDDDSCVAGAILDQSKTCKCLYNKLAGIDSSKAETCQACTDLETVGNGNVLRDSSATCACKTNAVAFVSGSSPYSCQCTPG